MIIRSPFRRKNVNCPKTQNPESVPFIWVLREKRTFHWITIRSWSNYYLKKYRKMEKNTNIWIYLNLSTFPSCILKDPNMRTPNFTKRPKIFIDTIHKLCKPNVDNVWFLFYRKYWNTISSIEIMNRLKILVLIDSLILKIVRLLEALLWGRNIFSPTQLIYKKKRKLLN